jgi:lipoate-protein ligase A
MWSQTPQFDLLLDASDDIGISMDVQHGVIKSLELKDSRLPSKVQEEVRKAVLEQKLQDVRNWSAFLRDRLGSLDEPTSSVAKRLDQLIPIPKLAGS